MRFMLPCVALLALALTVVAAPIPKSLKKLNKNYDFDGIWEQVGSNVNGAAGNITHGKYWKIDKDKFYYSMANLEAQGNLGTMTTPDESQPQYKNYSSSRLMLEIDGDTLKWIFTSTKEDKLETCEPGPGRSFYTFKRVK